MPEQEQEKNRPLVGVSVLIRQGGRILLEKPSKAPMEGAWKAPGGQMEFGETPEQAARREVQEELGIEIDTLKFRTMTNDVLEAEKKHDVTIWMEANYVSGDPTVKAPSEETERGWFTWDALPQPLYLPLQHLLAGETYPSQTTETKSGAAIETTPILPGEGAEALKGQTGETLRAVDSPDKTGTELIQG